MKIVQTPSQNFDKRKGKIAYLVLHGTSLGPAESLFILTQSKNPEVSTHYLIMKDGLIHELVHPANRAYHAGISDWNNAAKRLIIKSLNEYSIGIEFQAEQTPQNLFAGYTKKQIQAGKELCHHLMKTYHIAPQNVLGHSDVAPHRKEDPGILFPWRTLGKAKIGLWTDRTEPKNKKLLKLSMAELLQKIGYPIAYGVDECVIAFKRHYMPHAAMTKDVSLRTLKRAAAIYERWMEMKA